MASAPVLTKKQQKSSLSAKKTKTKQAIRTTLASPYSKYWPLISTKHSQQLKNILRESLPKIKISIKVPRSVLKNVPKSDRNRIRNEYINKQMELREEKLDDRSGLILGVNDVAKSLENYMAKAVLITEDVKPKLMVEHLIDQAVLVRTPVLVLPKLRNILKDQCGIASASVAFTDSLKFKLIQDEIEKIWNNYPVPRNHINFERSLQTENSTLIIIDDSMMDISQETNSEVLPEIPATIYLTRQNKLKRVFVPDRNLDSKTNNDKMDTDGPVFISLRDTGPKKQLNIRKYRPLKVKKIKGDTNRNKRKIDAMKNKKSRKQKKG